MILRKWLFILYLELISQAEIFAA